MYYSWQLQAPLWRKEYSGSKSLKFLCHRGTRQLASEFIFCCFELSQSPGEPTWSLDSLGKLWADGGLHEPCSPTSALRPTTFLLDWPRAFACRRLSNSELVSGGPAPTQCGAHLFLISTCTRLAMQTDWVPLLWEVSHCSLAPARCLCE